VTEELSLDEIKKRYPDVWVLISEPKIDQYQRVLSGKVLFHSKDREAVYQKAIDLQLPVCAFRYTGSPPADMAFAL
jgi:hypothetical protein